MSFTKFTLSHYRKPLGFTLVELIVVISILAVLSTVSFVAYTNMSSDARNSVRKTDMGEMKVRLRGIAQKTGSFPLPSSPVTLSNSGTAYVSQGWSDTIQTDNGSSFRADPRTSKAYMYATTANRQGYQVGMTFELGSDKYSAYVDGDYVPLAPYVFPSLLLATSATGNLEIKDGFGAGTANRAKFVVNNGTLNLPYDMNGKPVGNAATFSGAIAEPNVRLPWSSSYSSCQAIYEGGKSMGPGDYLIVSSTGALTMTGCTMVQAAAVPSAPGVPLASASTGVGYSAVTWNWQASAGASRYEFSTNNSTWSDKGNVLTFSETGLACGTSHTRYVRACNTDGCSASASLGPTSTSVCNLVASAATGMTATSIAWNWQASAGATRYEFSTNNSTWSDKGNVLTFSETALSCGTSYVRYARACDTVGCSASTTLATTATVSCAPLASAATSITATSMSWNWQSAAGATRYEFSTNNSTWSDKGAVLTFSETGLTCGTSYARYVRSCNASGCSASTTLATTATVSCVPLASAATGITTTGITWNWQSAAGASRYEFSTNNSTWSDKGAVLAFAETWLTCNTPYTRYVRSCNASGCSASTTLGSTSTAVCTPAAPLASAATSITATSMSWNWQSAAGATRYEFSTNNSTWSDKGNVLTFSETALSCGTSYARYVRACNAGGCSTSTTLATTATVSCAPLASAATSITATSMSWNWQSAAGAARYEFSTNNSTWSDKGLVLAFAETGLTCATSYTRYVRACNTSGCSTSATLGATSTAACPVLKPQDVFATSLYIGNGTSQTVTTGVDMTQGGIIWDARRAGADSGITGLVTEVAVGGGVGGNPAVVTNSVNANVGAGVSAVSTTGFTVNSSIGNGLFTNYSARETVAWSIRKAPKFFDVVRYTGNGTNGRLISHNLGITPGMIIIKRLETTGDWLVAHQSYGGLAGEVAGYNRTLNSNSSEGWYISNTGLPASPSTTFKVDNLAANVSGGSYVAYIFANDPDTTNGMIKTGMYAGGGGDVNLGWEPQFIMVKNVSGAYDWRIVDTTRGINNPIFPNTTAAETAQAIATITPTGWTPGGNVNNGGQNYIYVAIRKPY